MKNRRNYFIFIIIILSVYLNGKNLTIEQKITPSNYELLDVEIENNLMMIPGGLGGTSIFNISDPQNPVEISSISIPGCDYGRVYNWEINGSFAFAAGRDCGIAIVNLTNPEYPEFISLIDPEGIEGETRTYEDIESIGNILIAAIHSGGLRFFNIENPEHPLLISSIITDNAWSIAIKDDHVFVADGESGLSVIDFADALNPILINVIETSGGAKDVRIKDNTLYLAVGEGGVDAFDISNLDIPVFKSNYNTTGFASRVALVNDRIAVSDWDDLEVLEWFNDELVLSGFKNTGGRTMAVGAVGDVIFSAEWRYLYVFSYGNILDSDIDLSIREINFPFTPIGESNILSFDLSNNGSNDLEFEFVFISGTEFIANEDLTTLPPDSTITLDIEYFPSSSNASSEYVFRTNDPDEYETNVVVIGNNNGINIGEPAPNFELPIIYNGGGNFQLTDYLGSVVVIAYFAPW